MAALNSKSARHQRIVDVLAREEIRTQDELRAILMDNGFDVTQATLSRDLDELGATKVESLDGTSVYAVPEQGDPARVPAITPDADANARLIRLMDEVVTGITASLNIVVVHTRAGAAHYLAGAIDRNAIPQILGSVAGDDTVLLVTHPETSGEFVKDLLLEMVNTKNARKQSANVKSGEFDV
ncbi:MAG: hypothetical protein RIS75_907 [Actinomycetota bacterium]|jgi:transcriptional regulator of arginine metabolism